ncbi:MAG TPA: hypothetical protein VF128_08585 [Gemmatimonadaceae bacterium]
MKRIAILVVLAVTALFAACSTDGVDGETKKNQPPTVWLSAGPPEGSTSQYRVEMFWGGWDPDGEIGGYEYLISDNEGSFNPADTVGVPWTPVAGNDSTFTFSADEPVDTLNLDPTKQVAEFTRSHTFFIRAIDTQGTRSKLPAYRSFTAFTLSPEVRIEVPRKNLLNPADVPPISTFKWKAYDYVAEAPPTGISQPPDSVQWALKSTKNFDNDFEKTITYLRDYSASAADWYPWVWYSAPGDSGKFWTTPPVDPGNYIFAIRAKDEAGAVTPVLDEEKNVRRIRVGTRTSGPLITLSNEYMGVIRWTSCSPPLTIIDVPAGVPLIFKINGDASFYGGTVAGYRYGWDITDLNDPETWEIDLTPFSTENNIATLPPRTFFFGTHTLTVEVVDNNGYCSRVPVKVNIVQFTLERSLLIVDDDTTDDNSVGWVAGYPTDAEHDAFWRSMATEVAGFDPQLDTANTLLGYLPLTTLAKYKSIIWSVAADRDTPKQKQFPLLYAFIQHRPKDPSKAQAVSGKVEPDVIALAMAAGGHIMIAGRHPIQLVANRTYYGNNGLRYPVIWAYELEGEQATAPTAEAQANPIGDLSFAYRELCLETMDYAVLDKLTIWRRSTGSKREYCPTSNVRGPTGTASVTGDGIRFAAPLLGGYPTLNLRSEVTGADGWYREDVRSLDSEVYNPRYFQRTSGVFGSCNYAAPPRPCFQPIYGLGCLDTAEEVYNQPIAFFTSAYADRVADVPGAVAARSVVFGFPPVFMDPVAFRQTMDKILFDEWKLPRGASVSATAAGNASNGATPE